MSLKSRDEWILRIFTRASTALFLLRILLDQLERLIPAIRRLIAPLVP